MRHLAFGVVCGLLSLGLGLSAQEPAPKLDTSLDALLERMGEYIETFERQLAAVVAEEDYTQEVAEYAGVPAQVRVLRSDLLLTKAGDAGWVAYRDVYEVDGKEVRDRSDRLMNLFLKPTDDSNTQVKRIIEESTRLNLGWVSRNINVPTMVLEFGKPLQQYRSDFKRGGTIEVAAGVWAREIQFQERRLPRLIQTPDGAAARGRFWIDDATGRVMQTELRIGTGATTATIQVSYADQPKIKLWLPVLMNERYATPRQPLITGRAIYRNFRQFATTSSFIVKK